MKAQEGHKLSNQIQGLIDLLEDPEIKELAGKIKKILIRKALKWLLSIIKKKAGIDA